MKRMELTPEDKALIQARQEADAISSRNMEKLRFAAWWHWGFGALCVAATAGWLQTQNRIKDLEAKGDLRQQAIASHESWKHEHQQATNLRDERIQQLRKEFEAYRDEQKPRIKEHDEMWWRSQPAQPPR